MPGLGYTNGFSRRTEWQSTPVFLPGEFNGQGSLGAYSSGGHTELATTEQLRKHTMDFQFPQNLSDSLSLAFILFSFLSECFLGSGSPLLMNEALCFLMKQKEGDTGHRQLGFLSEVGLKLPGERGVA